MKQITGRRNVYIQNVWRKNNNNILVFSLLDSFDSNYTTQQLKILFLKE